MKKKTWNEFKETGLLWFINTTLHAFGWAIVIELDDNGKIADAYPARVTFRGFSEDSNTKGYNKITEYMSNNAEELLKEIQE